MSDKQTIARITPNIEYDGIAAEDLGLTDQVLKVTIPELSPNAASGTIGAGITTGSPTITTRDGTPINVNITSANHVVATWAGKSNHRVPPLVRKGEPVKVFQKATQDKWYWEETGRGRPFRTTDRVHIEVGATDSSKPGVDKNDTNTYNAYLDSESGKVGIGTSKANGEPAGWKAEFDTKNGRFYISDDSDSPGNRFYMDVGKDTGLPVIHMNLKSGATIHLEGDNGFIKLPKLLQISAGERLILDSPIMVLNMSQKGSIFINASSIAINAAKSMVVTAVTAGINAASTKIAGVFVTAAARIANVVKGPAGSNYSPDTINDPTSSPVVNNSNSPDTDMSGTPYT